MPKRNYSIGFDYNFNKNLSFGIANERGNYTSLRFIYKNNSKKYKKPYQYKKGNIKKEDNKYKKLIKNIEANGVGVNKIIETSDEIGIELTQFSHPNLDIIEEIVKSATFDSGIEKPIKKDLRISNLKALSEYDADFERNSTLIYQRSKIRKVNSNTGIKFRPYLASREALKEPRRLKMILIKKITFFLHQIKIFNSR